VVNLPSNAVGNVVTQLETSGGSSSSENMATNVVTNTMDENVLSFSRGFREMGCGDEITKTLFLR